MAKILIVDDDPDFRDICKMSLEKEGFQISEAANADEGFDKVQSEKPDLLILDVLMPRDYEGFDLARRIREELGMRKLPILMLTAVHGIKNVPYRFAPDDAWLPVDIFLDKPVAPSTLLQKVKEALGIHRQEPKEPL